LAHVEVEGSVKGEIAAYFNKTAVLAIDEIDLRK
jgi:hypothetical protein